MNRSRIPVQIEAAPRPAVPPWWMPTTMVRIEMRRPAETIRRTVRRRSPTPRTARKPAKVNSASWASLIHLLLKNADSRYEAMRMIRSSPYRP
jgi:hypothetical protein